MDLSSAIENFSEFFVAANTRTSLTDFAETTSNSLDPTNSNIHHHHHNSLSNMNAQSTSTSSSNNNNHHLGLSFDDQPSSNHSSPGGSIHKQLNEHTNHHSSGGMHNHMPSNSSGGGGGGHISKSDLMANHFAHHHHHHHHHNNHLDSATDCNDNNSTTNHSNEPSRQMNTSTNGHHQREYLKYHRKYRKSELYQAQASPTRLSQPMRTQIPIHCIIEQFDHYTPISNYTNYQTPLNDNDLFRTEDPMDPANSHTSHQTHNNNNSSTSSGTTSHNNNLNSNHNNQPHLHQSKLALESVTNGSTASISLTTNNHNNNNNNSLFSNNATTSNNHPDTSIFEQIDANLDQLRSDSPLSLGPNNPLDVALGNDLQPSGSSILDDPIGINQDPYLCTSNQQLSSSKETYVIVGSSTLYIDVLPVVLKNLGYSSLEIISAKATIQMKNWKPIPLDQVTDDKKATVGEIFADISSFATLRIVLVNSNSVSQVPMEWNETMIRQVVLALTQTMSQLTLSKLCNISQPLISAIVRGGKRLGRRKCMEFGQWYMNYVKSNEIARGPLGVGGSGVGGAGAGGLGGQPGHSGEGSGRLVFDKRREIPRLKSWFAENAKPSEELLQEYSRLMNEDPIRRDRPQVSAKALKNWWKNERQKLGIRQREIRGRPKLKQIDGGGGGGDS